MRAFSTISVQFWIGKTGKLLRTEPKEARIAATYLMSGPASNMYGLYYLSTNTAAEESGLTIPEWETAVAVLDRLKFAHFDPDLQWIWVREMAHYQMNAPLKPGDRRVQNINAWYQSLPRMPFLRPYYDRYHTELHLEAPRDEGEGLHLDDPDRDITTPREKTVWDAVLGRIQVSINRHSYYTWFKDTYQIADDGSRLVIEVPSSLYRDWLLRHFTDTIAKALAEVDRAGVEVVFVPEAES